MGEKQNQPFQLSFNPCLKVDFQGSRVTADGGLWLVRELDERGRERTPVDKGPARQRRWRTCQQACIAPGTMVFRILVRALSTHAVAVQSPLHAGD